VAVTVGRALAGHAPTDVVVAPGLPVPWRPQGVVEDDGGPVVDLASFTASVTGVAVAIAQAGTLVLDGSPSVVVPPYRCSPTCSCAWSPRTRSSAASPRHWGGWSRLHR
jgi:hypothetical protein